MPIDGVILDAEDFLIATLAACPEFQSLVGAANATVAMGSIRVEVLPPPSNLETKTPVEVGEERPMALLWTDKDGEGITLEHSSSGTKHHYDYGGLIHLQISRTLPAGETLSASMRGWKGIVGRIIEELDERFGLPGYLAPSRVTMLGPYVDDTKKSTGLPLMQWSKLMVVWKGC